MSNTIEQVQYAAKDGVERTMSGLKEGVANATAGMEQAQAGMRDGMQKAMRTAEDMFSFSQGNFEAFAKSSQILATGLQDMGQTVAATARANFEDVVSTFKAMTAVRSVKEAMDLQAGLMRGAMERAVSQTSQLTDTSIKLTEQAFAPITARVAMATEKLSRA